MPPAVASTPGSPGPTPGEGARDLAAGRAARRTRGAVVHAPERAVREARAVVHAPERAVREARAVVHAPGRAVHPLAWWAWALALAVATTRTANPLLLALLVAAVVLVVVTRRDGSPWARAFGAYLVLGGVVIGFRVVFHVLVGIKAGGPVLFPLPRVDLPEWAAGIVLLGPVHAGGLLRAAYGGLALAALLVCVGAGNALANPKRALRALPASLHHLSTAVVVAVTVAPQLVTAFARVRRAQRLRGVDARGPRAIVACVMPVLEDALGRALALAASMDSRGYARATPGTSDARVTGAALLALVAAVLGTYGLLDGTAPAWLGAPLLLGAGALAVVASVAAGRRVTRTRYRPDRWGAEESMIAGCGAVAAAGIAYAAHADPAVLGRSVDPLAWPTVTPLVLACVALAALPALLGGRGAR